MAEEKVELLGEIDLIEPVPSTKSRLMALTMSSAAMRQWLATRRESVQPWPTFLDYKKFKTPKTIAPIGNRVIKNIERFQSNYMFIFAGLVIFCILTSPMLLVAIAACLGACYLISLKNAENKLKVMGHELSLVQQYSTVAVLSFPLFWLAGAGGAVFWVIGASFFVIMMHAALYSLEEETPAFDLDSVEVV